MRKVRPYADFAEVYLSEGLRVIPTGEPDGKVPHIKGWRKTTAHRSWALIEKFPEANIAIIDGGQSGITRIDIDDQSLIDPAIDRFGATPIMVSTPSGGLHLWYRWNGEDRQLHLEDMKIDVLGEGGYGLVPPSMHPQKGVYSFLEGHSGRIGELPTIRPGALPQEAAEVPKSPKPQSKMRDGDGRNIELFRIARLKAVDAKTFEELRALLIEENGAFAEPLPIAEVEKIACSVWRYKTKGRLLVPGGEATAFVTAGESEVIGGYSDACLLLYRLRLAHGGRGGEPFALANALAVSLGWGLTRFRKARDFLEDEGFIECLSCGGRGPCDPPYYRILRR